MLLFFHLAVASANTTIVGNGGDSVRCEPTSANSFRGLYSLDYLLTYTESNDNKDVVPIFNWEESLQRLSKILKKNPDLDYSFQTFNLDLQNYFDPTRPKIWHESSYGLVDIKDERIIRKVPSNCYKFSDPETIHIIQTIISLKLLNKWMKRLLD